MWGGEAQVEAGCSLCEREVGGAACVGQGLIARPRCPEVVDMVRVDVEEAASVGAAEPLLAGRRIERAAEFFDVQPDRAQSLRAVVEERDAGGPQRLGVNDLAADP